jgi:hypothetical protein
LDCSAIEEEEEEEEEEEGDSHRFIIKGLVKKDVAIAGIVMQSAFCDTFSRNCDCRGSVGCVRQL